MRMSLFRYMSSFLSSFALLILSTGLFFPIVASATSEIKLTASNAGSGDAFARAVSVDGNIALLGAPMEDDPTNSGAAYVYRFDGSNWIEEAKLSPVDTASGDEFGYSVSIYGSVAVIGAHFDDDAGSKSGSAYIYRFDGTNWIEEAKLTASDATSGDEFAQSVSVYGNTVVVGAHWEAWNRSGAAYVYRYDGVNWIEEAKLTASDAGSYDYFGHSVSIYDDALVVGALFDDDLGSQSGAAYIYRYDGTNWIEEAKLTASDGGSTDDFGSSVSISSNAVLIGARSNGPGAAYVFRYDGSNWIEEDILRASDGTAIDYFGNTVSLDNNMALVGAPYDDDLGSSSGSAYLYQYDGATWAETAKLTASDGTAWDKFGYSVSIYEGLMLIGARFSDGLVIQSGAAYIVTPAPQTSGPDLGFSSVNTPSGSGAIVRHSIGSNGRDFATLQAWENARDGDLLNRHYFATSAQAGAFSEGELVFGQTSGAQGTYLQEQSIPSSSETRMSLDSVSGIFQAGETLIGATSGASTTLDNIISTTGTIEKAEVYADSPFQTGLIIDGSITDADHYMWLSVPPSERHQGQAGLGVVLDPINLGHVIHINDAYTHIEGLEITGWPNQNGSNAWSGIYVEAGNALLENLLIHDDDAGGFSNSDADAINLKGMAGTQSVTIRNNIIYNIGRGAIHYEGTANIIVNIHNVNIYNTGISAGADGEGGINNNSTTATLNVINTLSLNSGSGNDFKNAGIYGDVSNNISSDFSAPGINSLTQVLAQNLFVSITPGSEDLHLNATGSAVDTGIDLSAQFIGDIDSEVRTGLWDIGADELQSSITVSSFSAKITGNLLTLNDQISNIGDLDAAAFQMAYYLSLDAIFDVSDTLICDRSVNGLTAGAFAPVTGTTETICAVPSVSAGNYFVVAFVDALQVIAEINENNNTASSELILVGNPVPILTSLTPNTSLAGSADINLTITGTNFISSSLTSFDGNTLATSFVSSTQLTAVIPASLLTTPGNFSVTIDNPAPGGGVSNVLTFTITALAPTIQNISPSSGKIGTVITLTGQNFDAIPSNNTVSFNSQAAIITAATSTQITTTVPQGATSGTVVVTTQAGTANSPMPFTVTLSEDFLITSSPFSVDVVPGGQTTVQVQLSGAGTAGFSGLIGLSVTTLPTDVVASFLPSIGQTGQTSFLNLYTPTTLLPGAYAITVEAAAEIDGQNIVRNTGFTLNVLAPGTTTLSGQILSSDTGNPLANIRVKNGATSITTDAAGNFFFSSISSGTQLLLIDGTPAETPEVSYPIDLPVQVEVTPNINNILPYPVYLHTVNTKNVTSLDTSTADVIVSDPDIPGFELTIPQGVEIIGWDGQPNTEMSIKRVPIARSPLPPISPETPTFNIYMFHFFKAGGGTPTQPIPVKYPNDAGLAPGTVVDLYYYDEEPIADPTSHQWKKFGTGTVSSDARQIISDPGVGIPKFCCGGTFFTWLFELFDDKETPDDPPKDGDPVSLVTGIFELSKTDMVLPGVMPIQFTRYYSARKGLLNSLVPGPFGSGTNHDYNIRLLPFGTSGEVLLLVEGDDGRARFAINADGTFSNDTVPSFKGAVLTIGGGSVRTLRFKDGRRWIFSSTGFLNRIEDRNGNGLDLIRSGGLLSRIIQPGGREIQLAYDGASRISRLTDPLGRTVRYLYDSNGMLSTVIDPEGGLTRYRYDNLKRMTTITDARGILFLSNEYDSNDRVIQQTNAEGGVYQFLYFGPEGEATLDIPDFIYRPIALGPGCGSIAVIDAGTSPPSGRRCVIEIVRPGPASYLVSQSIVIDPNKNPTSYRFNTEGYPIEITDAAGKTTRFEREVGSNQLLSTTDALGRKTSFTYDNTNNLLSTTDPEGNVTTFTYESTFNRVETITDALNQVTTFIYDATGNLLSTTDPSGAVTNMGYTPEGQPQTVTDPLGNVTQFAYDTNGNLQQSIDPLGNITNRAYDPVSRLLTVTDPRGETTAFVYDDLNRVTKITDPGSGMTTFSYDENGNLLTVTDANSNTSTYTYDVQDRLETRIDPLTRIESYAYDLNGNLEAFIDRKNQNTTFVYDPLNRRMQTDYADGSQTTFTYDTAGRLDRVNEGTSSIEFTYDNLDRLIEELSPQGIISYTYDILGRRNTMSVNGSLPVNYTYDTNSRLTQVAQGTEIVGLNYDLAGRRTNLSYSNGTSTTYAYDNASRLTNITHQSGATPFESITYTYDAAGNRISLDRTNGASILLPESVQAAYDAANEQIQFNSTTPNLSYDANGNLTSQTDASGTTNYTWDARNRLSNINGPTTTASFVYDALGRRTSKTINGVQTDYQYDGHDIVTEIGGGAVGVSYLRSLNIDEPFVRQSTTNEYYHVDALGSTLDLTDSAGAVETTYEYEAFGKTTITGNSTNPFQYTGRENDGEGLYYYRARYYSVRLERFISEDPIELAGGDINFYRYVWNSPSNFMDPTGEAVIKVRGCEPSEPSLDGRKGAENSQTKNPLSLFLDTCDPENFLIFLPGPATIRGPTKEITKGMLRQFEKQLAKHGKRSLEKSLGSLDRRLAEHLKKLPNLKFKSSVKREIRNFRSQIEAIKRVLEE